MKKTKKIISVIALMAIPTISYAAVPLDLGDIIVSGGFTPVATEKYGRSVSIITAQDLEESGVTTIQDALRRVPGVSVNSTGDAFTQIRLRGSESNHVLVLIDGVEAMGGDGEYPLSGLDVYNIERIEILRGAQSVYYGSNASSGVINIIMKKAKLGKTASVEAEIGTGYRLGLHAGLRKKDFQLTLNASSLEDKGYDVSGDNGEKDGIDRDNLHLSGDYQLSEDIKLGFMLRLSGESYDFDQTNYLATNADDYVVDNLSQNSLRNERNISVFAEYLSAQGRAKSRLSYEDTQFDLSNTTADTKSFKYLTTIALDQNIVENSNHIINAFIEKEENSSSQNIDYNRSTNSYAIEYRGSLGLGLDIQAGARLDDNSVFGDALTWNTSLAYTLKNDIRFHASAGTGSVNPTYFELFANAWGTVGNPNLTPEKNKTFDIGVYFPIFNNRGYVDVTYFNETLHDEITFISTSTGSTYENQAGRSTRKGFEIIGAMDITDRLDMNISYTRLDAKNPDGSIEIRRPEQKLNLGATLDIFDGRGTVAADIKRVIGNYDSEFFGSYSTKKLPDYTTVDLSVKYDLTDHATLTGRISNLTDAQYSDVWGYATRGRTAYIGLRTQW